MKAVELIIIEKGAENYFVLKACLFGSRNPNE
jgi:hypothetical protein